jgi:hypothetical protein
MKRGNKNFAACAGAKTGSKRLRADQAQENRWQKLKSKNDSHDNRIQATRPVGDHRAQGGSKIKSRKRSYGRKSMKRTRNSEPANQNSCEDSRCGKMRLWTRTTGLIAREKEASAATK